MVKPKKISACLMAAVMVTALASCGKNTVWSAVIDGRELPAGIFISYQLSAYLEVSDYIPEDEYDENGSLINPDFDVLDIIVEDKPAREWINARATQKLREFVAVENKFAELGLSLPSDEYDKAKLSVEQLWDYNPYAAYGLTDFDSFGTMYEKLGISRQSQIEIFLNDSKATEIFEYYYGENGVNAVSMAEILQFIRDNGALIKYIEMPLKDGEGNLLKSADKAQRLTMANDYAERAKAGESFDGLINEFNGFYSALIKDAAKAETESLGLEWFDDGSYDIAAKDDNGVVITKESVDPDQAVVDKVFGGGMSVGDVAVIELDEVYYVVTLLDIAEDEEYVAEVEASVRKALRGDEYLELVSLWTQGQNVVLNEAALKRYTADTLSKFA
jgi:hypothetical protein